MPGVPIWFLFYTKFPKHTERPTWTFRLVKDLYIFFDSYRPLSLTLRQNEYNLIVDDGEEKNINYLSKMMVGDIG